MTPFALRFIYCAAALAGAGALMHGCTADQRAPEAASAYEHVYDLTLVLDLRDGSGAEEYYTIKDDGTFGFGGGMDARLDRTSWTTRLAADEMQRLSEMMAEHGWFSGQLRSTNQPSEARYSIRVWCRQGSLQKRITGENDRIEPVRAALRSIADRRLERDLDRQPKASVPQPATAPAAQPQE